MLHSSFSTRSLDKNWALNLNIRFKNFTTYFQLQSCSFSVFLFKVSFPRSLSQSGQKCCELSVTIWSNSLRFCSFFEGFSFHVRSSEWVEEASYQLLSRKSTSLSHKYGNGPPRKMCIKGARPRPPNTKTCEIRQINRLAPTPPLVRWGYLAWMDAQSSTDHPCHAPQQQPSHSWHLEWWYVASDEQKRDREYCSFSWWISAHF